jgi:hypothetical protein
MSKAKTKPMTKKGVVVPVIKDYKKAILIDTKRPSVLSIDSYFQMDIFSDSYFNYITLSIGSFRFHNNTRLCPPEAVATDKFEFLCTSNFYIGLRTISTELLNFCTFLTQYKNKTNEKKNYSVLNKPLIAKKTIFFNEKISCYLGEDPNEYNIKNGKTDKNVIVVIFHGLNSNFVLHFQMKEIQNAIKNLSNIEKEVSKFADVVENNLKIQAGYVKSIKEKK